MSFCHCLLLLIVFVLFLPYIISFLCIRVKWLMLCVNLTGLLGCLTFGATLFGLCLWQCFWMKLTSESVDSKMWVGLFQIIKDLNRTKILNRREFLWPDCFKLGRWSFSTFRHELKHWLFPGLEAANPQTGIYAIGPLEGLANCRFWGFSASIVIWAISRSLYIYTYILLVLFVWRTLTNTMGHGWYSFPIIHST